MASDLVVAAGGFGEQMVGRPVGLLDVYVCGHCRLAWM